MSNPFKIKKIDAFTIKDCESYLAQYPYGEHYIEVKKRLGGLKTGKIKFPEEIEDKQKNKKPQSTRSKSQGKPIKLSTNNDTQQVKKDQPTLQNKKIETHSDSGEGIGDTILSWIFIIVIVIVAGTIIIYALDTLLPKEAVAFIGKYKYIIYGIGMLIAKGINEKS